MSEVPSIFNGRSAYWGKTTINLPEEITAATGFTKAIGLVFDTPKSQPCIIDNCHNKTMPLECRIIEVMGPDEQTVDINQLPPDIIENIRAITTTVHLCASHLLEQFADNTASEYPPEDK